ncbi:hypothetical protein O6H91_02G155200 [Diphasiastrum complanatum]|uniref:Uncharacterized protein n=1 Tax=Diphasiastrum complanatum TaxID=34168 RepID=A0ACC2EMC7_DIPCM|nr:hypothetical protein O6H91_02G155200 [Diphasiastrum complanatum]
MIYFWNKKSCRSSGNLTCRRILELPWNILKFYEHPHKENFEIFLAIWDHVSGPKSPAFRITRSGTWLQQIAIRWNTDADDVALVFSTREDLQRQLDNPHDFCTRWGLRVNIEKTKVMVFNTST